MKLIRFLNYDINEGLFRYWKRFLSMILLGIVFCAIFNKKWEFLIALYGEESTLLGYGIEQFWGRLPFPQEAFQAGISFELPFAWLLLYLLLAYCIGSYVRDDMEGMGAYLMVKSRQRSIWWISKVLWCVLVNVVYFGLLWCVNIGYAWIAVGDVRFEKQEMLLMMQYGSQVAYTETETFLLMTVLLPFMVGVVQSLLQMIGTICFGGIPAMIGTAGILVLSCYYGGKFLPHGYAMVTRYYPDISQPDMLTLQADFGIAYLAVWILALVVIGYLILRKKNILDNR